MFDIGALEFLVLGIAALFIFGPDRLPEMARKAARGLRELRSMAANARRDLSRELGPEFDDLDLRDLNPRQFVKKHVLDGIDEDDLRVDKDIDLRDDLRVDTGPRSSTASRTSDTTSSAGTSTGGSDTSKNGSSGGTSGTASSSPTSVNGSGHDADGDGSTATLTHKPPPFDPDAT